MASGIVYGRTFSHIREIKLHVYGKQQTSDSNWEFLKIENGPIKQLKTILMDKKLLETANLCLEIMNSKRQQKGSRVQIRVCRKRDA